MPCPWHVCSTSSSLQTSSQISGLQRLDVEVSFWQLLKADLLASAPSALTGSSERPDLASGQMPERQTSEELQSHFEGQLEGAETPDSLLQEGYPYGRCELV